MAASTEAVACVGCGAVLSAPDGPTHGYLGVSPGCCAVYGEVLAKHYSDYRLGPLHRLTVDAYSVQHPGNRERRTIKSVAGHLIGLYVTLERGYDSARSLRAIRHALLRG